MNREIFRIIRGLSTENDNYIMTLTDGDLAGEKAVISNQKMIFSSPDNGFLRKKEGLLSNIKQSGITVIDGHRVYAEHLARRKRLVICGAGHVALPVIRIARMTDFHVICIDDRYCFAKNAEDAGADRVIQDDFNKALDSIRSDQDTYFVIVTRKHIYDLICLRQIINMENAYIGLMGSKKRSAIVKEKLIEEGVPREIVDNIHTPIGIDIKAETPAEIAVAIMAEIIKIKNECNDNTYFSDEILDELLKNDGLEESSRFNPDDRIILAEIIGRNGSAPRNVGSKMLILPNGDTVGTIGGGCLEAKVIQRAQQMFDEDKSGAELFSIDLTGGGMVCGGKVDVMIEMF